MADPREVAPQARRANLTPLMKAKANATTGEKVNFCPFGCTLEDLDDHGYCDHLIGFTNDGKTFEPMEKDGLTGRRVVQVPRDDDGRPKLSPVMRKDVLVPITISSRVYREVKDSAQSA